MPGNMHNHAQCKVQFKGHVHDLFTGVDNDQGGLLVQCTPIANNMLRKPRFSCNIILRHTIFNTIQVNYKL